MTIHTFLRACFAALLAAAFLPAALAQYDDVQLSPRPTGSNAPLALEASNQNCQQPLDFRFTSRTPWIKMPADPVARQIPAGQSRSIQATIDLTGVPPGPHQGFVDVDCENCGWFIFANCKVDKRQLRLNLNVIANEGAAAPPPNGVQLSRLDPNDPGLPDHIRKQLKAAYTAEDALKNKDKDPCEEKLAKARQAAADAKAKADKLQAEADAAGKAVAEADKNLADAEKARAGAGKALEEAAKALDDAAANKKLVDQGTSVDRKKEAEAEVAIAEAKLRKAQETVNEAQNALNKARDAAKKAKSDAAAAKPKQADIDAAKQAADKAAAELAKVEAECLAAKAAGEKAAKDAVKAAEAAARNHFAQALQDAEERVKQAEANANRCKCKRTRLLLAQFKAIQALGILYARAGKPTGALTQYIETLKQAATAIGAVPGCPYGAAIELAMNTLAAGASAIDATSVVLSAAEAAALIPGSRSHDPTDTKTFIANEIIKGDDITPAEVYEQLKNYAEPHPDSHEKLDEDRMTAEQNCQNADGELKRAKEALEKAQANAKK